MTTIGTGAGFRAGTTPGPQLSSTDGGLIVRTARNRYRCTSARDAERYPDSPRARDRSPDCVGWIEPGTHYVECVWSAPAYRSGDRYCTSCALVAFDGYLSTVDAGDTAAEGPRCPTCGEPGRLLVGGSVGHCGDEYGYDCIPVPVDGCACEDCEALRAGAAHRQVAGWGGVPGECGVECACGTTFDGFETLAEASEMLDGHIADETARAEFAARQRAEYVAGLRELAAVLEANPDLELPYTGRGGSFNVIPHHDQRRQLAAWARVMHGQKTKSTSTDGTCFYLEGTVAGIRVVVIANREEVCERIVVATREVVEEMPDPAALAALPKVTVTKTVDDVEWVCHPLLDDARVGAS